MTIKDLLEIELKNIDDYVMEKENYVLKELNVLKTTWNKFILSLIIK